MSLYTSDTVLRLHQEAADNHVFSWSQVNPEKVNIHWAAFI